MSDKKTDEIKAQGIIERLKNCRTESEWLNELRPLLTPTKYSWVDRILRENHDFIKILASIFTNGDISDDIKAITLQLMGQILYQPDMVLFDELVGNNTLIYDIAQRAFEEKTKLLLPALKALHLINKDKNPFITDFAINVFTKLSFVCHTD